MLLAQFQHCHDAAAEAISEAMIKALVVHAIDDLK